MSVGVIAQILKLFFLLLIGLNILIWFFDSEQILTLIPVNLFFITFLLPIYLISRIKHSSRGNFRTLIQNISILMVAIALNYWLWGMVSGLLFSPDGETVAVLLVQTVLSVIILAGGSVLKIHLSKR
jgi:nitrogen fixation-related uncharacterized protein